MLKFALFVNNPFTCNIEIGFERVSVMNWMGFQVFSSKVYLIFIQPTTVIHSVIYVDWLSCSWGLLRVWELRVTQRKMFFWCWRFSFTVLAAHWKAHLSVLDFELSLNIELCTCICSCVLILKYLPTLLKSRQMMVRDLHIYVLGLLTVNLLEWWLTLKHSHEAITEFVNWHLTYRTWVLGSVPADNCS